MSKTAREVIAEIAPEPEISTANIGIEDADMIIATLDAAGFEIVPKKSTEEIIQRLRP